MALLWGAPSFARDVATIARVVDGDTLIVNLNSTLEEVRLIGLAAPKKDDSKKLRRTARRTKQDEATIKQLGAQASAFTQSLVHPGDIAQLEYGQKPRDKSDRLYAFVWLADGRMLNETLICEGYANALTRHPIRSDYMERFQACEQQAREQGRGLWASSGSVEEPVSQSTTEEVRGTRKRKVYYVPGCPYYTKVNKKNGVIFATEDEAQQAGYRKAKNCP
jgi:endonuclease YncB( thermonuclease family)